MKKSKTFGFRMLLNVFVLFLSTLTLTSAPVVKNLQVEYTTTPIGIDLKTPRFIWQMGADDNTRGYFQSAYRIEVTDSGGAVVWDTDKVGDNVSISIKYNGKELDPETRYNWKVTVWDQDGKASSATSWFETGLLNQGAGAWNGAQWIGGGDEESGSTKDGFILGANDNRLLDKNMNIYNIESKRNGSYVMFELDISDVDGTEKGMARFNIYRVGYHPDDLASKPLISINVPLDLINSDNKYQPHNITIESIFGSLAIYVDGTGNNNALKTSQATGRRGGGLNINPVGNSGDYISFPMVADIGFSVDAGQKAAFSNITI